MKITLISVSGRFPTDGTRLISALLKRDRHHVTNIYLTRIEPEYDTAELQLMDAVLRKTEIVMIAVYSNYSARAKYITDYIHQKYPGLMVVWGGPHCISVPELSLRHADGVCFSEGDQAVPEFMNRLEASEDFTTTPNMAFKRSGSMIVNPVLPPFANLDELPYYDYGIDDHFLLDGKFTPLTKNMMCTLLEQYPFYTPTIFILTSRGCPHQCAYCNNCRYFTMFGRNFIRFYSVDRVIDEVKQTLDNLGFIEFVGFGDDDFFARPLKQIEAFAERYRNEIHIPFGIAASARTFHQEKLNVLLNAGLKVFNMGVQSGSQRIIDGIYNRKISLVKTKAIIEKISHYSEKTGLVILLDFIIDNPYETKEDIMHTYRYLMNLPIQVKPNLFFLSFFPGTPIYDRAVHDKLIEKFDETQFRSYTRSMVRYQKNYETFLVLLLRIVKLHKKLRKTPKWLLRCLGSDLVRKLATLLPISVYEKGINRLQMQKAWRKNKTENA